MVVATTHTIRLIEVVGEVAPFSLLLVIKVAMMFIQVAIIASKRVIIEGFFHGMVLEVLIGIKETLIWFIRAPETGSLEVPRPLGSAETLIVHLMNISSIGNSWILFLKASFMSIHQVGATDGDLVVMNNALIVGASDWGPNWIVAHRTKMLVLWVVAHTHVALFLHHRIPVHSFLKIILISPEVIVSEVRLLATKIDMLVSIVAVWSLTVLTLLLLVWMEVFVLGSWVIMIELLRVSKISLIQSHIIHVNISIVSITILIPINQ